MHNFELYIRPRLNNRSLKKGLLRYCLQTQSRNGECYNDVMQYQHAKAVAIISNADLQGMNGFGVECRENGSGIIGKLFNHKLMVAEMSMYTRIVQVFPHKFQHKHQKHLTELTYICELFIIVRSTYDEVRKTAKLFVRRKNHANFKIL